MIIHQLGLDYPPATIEALKKTGFYERAYDAVWALHMVVSALSDEGYGATTIDDLVTLIEKDSK